MNPNAIRAFVGNVSLAGVLLLVFLSVYVLGAAICEAPSPIGR